MREPIPPQLERQKEEGKENHVLKALDSLIGRIEAGYRNRVTVGGELRMIREGILNKDQVDKERIERALEAVIVTLEQCGEEVKNEGVVKTNIDILYKFFGVEKILV